MCRHQATTLRNTVCLSLTKKNRKLYKIQRSSSQETFGYNALPCLLADLRYERESESRGTLAPPFPLAPQTWSKVKVGGRDSRMCSFKPPTGEFRVASCGKPQHVRGRGWGGKLLFRIPSISIYYTFVVLVGRCGRRCGRRGGN
ncbi:hypothetical protein RR46_00965 [Papilio xuthus]|uniref:Uncharacterized protein n=1 Tax=Papilio xuthus TaxID=66420 RepID=A0A0N1IDC3_PAPXU|nr:hypothetical protein RR46_00965 [Papilio xuthus]